MKFFYFIARNISYTFAVIFMTIWGAVFASIFVYFLGTSFIIFSYDKIVVFLQKYMPISITFVSVLHFIQYGLFNPIRIPAFSRNHRILNEAFRRDYDLPLADVKKVYQIISDLPMNNMLASFFYVAFAIFLIALGAFYEYYFASRLNLEEMKMIFKVISLSGVMGIIIYGMWTYLLTESLTNNERSRVYNHLLKEGHRSMPKILIGIRVKFIFFIILMVITLLTFSVLMEKSRFYSDYSLGMILLYILLSVLAGFLLMQITTTSILRILKDMRRVAREIAAGGRAGFEVISLEKEFASIEYAMMEMAWEIDDYRRSLEDKVEQRTLELQTALTDLRSRDDQIQKQLDMASVIQRSILPGRIEDWNELRFSVRYIAMEKIGGDFYDVHQLKDDKLGIMIADVSGHGIPAALVTTMAKITFGNAGSKYDSPRMIFQEVNKSILEHIRTQDYMTCFMLSIDDEYNVVYSNASHQKAIHLRTSTGEIEHLDTNGLFIGAVEEARDTYEEKAAKMEYGDRIILYTDGIPEAINEGRKEYSNKRLDDVVQASKDLPLEDFSDAILRDVQNFIGSAQVVDDITFLVIELQRDEAVDLIKTSKRLINSHNYNEAINVLEKGLAKYPDNQKIIYNLAKNYFRVNSYPEAIRYMENYLLHETRNKFAYYICGASYYQTRDYPSAIRHFSKAIEMDSGFVNAHFASGMAYKKMDQAADAIRSFEKVISFDPENKMALFELKELREKPAP